MEEGNREIDEARQSEKERSEEEKLAKLQTGEREGMKTWRKIHTEWKRQKMEAKREKT